MKTGRLPLPTLRFEKLLDQLRERIRYLHYSMRTEQAYVHWARAFIHFHDRRHPAEMGRPEVELFLSWLTNKRKVSASTHSQALSALLFLYGKVLGVDLPWMSGLDRPRGTKRLPVVLWPDEIARIFAVMEGEHRLFAQLLYGTGLRITEGLQLRVKDVDFARRASRDHRPRGERWQGSDRHAAAEPYGWAARTVGPRWGPLACRSGGRTRGRRDARRTGAEVSEGGAFMDLVLGLSAGDVLGGSALGHADVSTTMIYTHVLNIGRGGVRSPVDSLPDHAAEGTPAFDPVSAVTAFVKR